MANGWTPTPTPPMASFPPQPSGLRKASAILLLVGAILAAVGAAMLLLFTIIFSVVFSRISDADGSGLTFFLWFYGAFGLLAAVGSALGFVAWRKAARDDLQGAFVWGLVGSLLPPVNVVSLLGAIFAKVCPEGEAQSRGAAPPQPPQVR